MNLTIRAQFSFDTDSLGGTAAHETYGGEIVPTAVVDELGLTTRQNEVIATQNEYATTVIVLVDRAFQNMWLYTGRGYEMKQKSAFLRRH